MIDPDDDPDLVGPAPARPDAAARRRQRGASSTPPPVERLTDWVRAARAPVAAVVAGRAEDLATCYRGVAAEVRRSRCGLLLRPGPLRRRTARRAPPAPAGRRSARPRGAGRRPGLGQRVRRRGPGAGPGGRAVTASLRRSAHVRVAVVGRRDERLLDRARRHPAQQVPDRAGLVVRARGPGPAERLLTDHGSGRLVVDVEVAGREAQRSLGLDAPRRGRGRTPHR